MNYTVFCGSGSGSRASFKSEAFLLGTLLATRNINLVYGGCKVGLMGALADGVLSKNGHVIGVFPEFLENRELVHPNLSELILVKDMAERKRQLLDLSQGFIALPGGFGTLEEFFEVVTFAQLGLFEKPIGLLNLEGFYNPLLDMMQHMVKQGFVQKDTLDLFVVADNVLDLLEKLKRYRSQHTSKWEQVGL